jgi:hypothetical protein
MSRHSEIKDQYAGYAAALEAVKKTNPGKVSVVYKEKTDNRYEGLFIYDSENETIRIMPRGRNNDYVDIEAAGIPALIKALREFFE